MSKVKLRPMGKIDNVVFVVELLDFLKVRDEVRGEDVAVVVN